MRLDKILEKNEAESDKGTYARLRFSQDDEDVIIGITEEMGGSKPNQARRDTCNTSV